MSGKLYGGGGTFKTGPAAQTGDQAINKSRQAKGSFDTGPGRMNPNMGDIGKKNQAKGTMTSGTKGDTKGEDSGGKA